MASSVMHFYSISYAGFLGLPLYTFWELAKNIDRIRADEDRRLYRAVGHAFGGEGERYLQSLREEQGSVVGVDSSQIPFDKTGFERLKAMMK